jgi:hypothetical protein
LPADFFSKQETKKPATATAVESTPIKPATSPDVRTASQVRRDQVNEVNKSFADVFAHPYDNILKPAVGTVATITAHPYDPSTYIKLGQGLVDALSPLKSIVHGAEYLQNEAITENPNAAKVLSTLTGLQLRPGPSSAIPDAMNPADLKASADIAGSNAGQIIAGEAINEASKPLGAAIQQRAANKAADLATKKAAYPTAYTSSVEPAAEAFNVKRGENKFTDFADQWDIAANEIKQSGDKLFKNGITDNRSQIIAGKDAMDRIYNTDIGPKVGLVGDQRLDALADKLKSQIPAEFSDAERRVIIRGIDDQLGTGGDRMYSGPEIEKLRQKFSAADRVNQAVNNYVGKALEKTPKGWLFKTLDMGLRDFEADLVQQVQPGTDIRPALKRYGAVTDIIQQAGGIPVDKSIMELVTGKAYITGTAPNITGRIVEAATKHWYANDRLISRAYRAYDGPVVRPVAPNTNVTTLSGTQPAIPLTNGWPTTSTEPTIPHVNGPLFNNPVKSGIDQVGTTNKQLVPVEHPPAQEYISPDEWSSMNPHGTGTINAPSRVGSTQFDRNQLYGNAPVQRQLPAAPFKFTIPGNSPIEVRVGSSAETPRILQRTTDTSGSMSNRFPPNWQLDSTPDPLHVGLVNGERPTVNSGGPGTLMTTDPKVVENTIAQYDKLIKSTRVKTKVEALQVQRDALVKQLIEYNRQRGAR